MRGGRGQDARGLLGGGGGRFFVDGVRIVLQRFPSHAAAVDALRLHLLGHQLHVRAQHLIVRAARRRVAIRYPLRARNRRLPLCAQPIHVPRVLLRHGAQKVLRLPRALAALARHRLHLPAPQ
jgi:hypothetical protein